MRQSWLLALSALCLGALPACGGDDEQNDDHTHPGDGDSDACSSSTVTFAEVDAFSTKYCAACHTDAASPVCTTTCKDHIFASENDWKNLGVHALEAVKNGSMPKSGPKPTAAEISTLEEWVSCNAEAHDHQH